MGNLKIHAKNWVMCPEGSTQHILDFPGIDVQYQPLMDTDDTRISLKVILTAYGDVW